MVDEFIHAVKLRWPHCLIQFEDFSNENALTLLEKYRDRHLCFNDDIQVLVLRSARRPSLSEFIRSFFRVRAQLRWPVSSRRSVHRASLPRTSLSSASSVLEEAALVWASSTVLSTAWWKRACLVRYLSFSSPAVLFQA